MRSVTYIVSITLFGIVAARWNGYRGYDGQNYGPQHWGSRYEPPHFGHHESHQGPYHFGPHRKSSYVTPPNNRPQFSPPHESPHFSSHHESPYFKAPDESSHYRSHYSTPHFGHPQQHYGYHFRPSHHHPPHNEPHWEGSDWVRPRPGMNDYFDNNSSGSNSSEEDYNDDDPGPVENTQTTAQWNTPATVQTTTETTRSISNKTSSYRNTYRPWFTSFTIQKESQSDEATNVTELNSTIVERCVNSCQNIMTPEYNPVCGTNNETYQNIGSLLCAKSCGVDVALKRKSACPRNDDIFTNGLMISTTEPTVDEPNTTSGQDTATTHLTTNGQGIPTPLAVSGRSKMAQSILNCMHTCPFNAEFSPVCGTDLVTYFNHDRFMCAKKCGVDVELKCRFACATSNCHGEETTTTTATTTTSAINLAKTTPTQPSLQHCLSTCAVTDEYNPVCGTNKITYGNPSKLLCAQLCGINVRVQHQFMCLTTLDDATAPSTPPTYATAASTTLPPFTIACMRGCVVTPDYNPVCGTNHVTYTNPGRLDCAKMCGVDVEILFNSACKVINPNDFTQPTEPSTNIDDVTQPQSTTTTTTTSGFTIDQGLLDRIFGKNGTTTETVPTTEEVFDIDPRFNNL